MRQGFCYHSVHRTSLAAKFAMERFDMYLNTLRIVSFCLCFAGSFCADVLSQNPASQSKPALVDLKSIQGLWSGSWGGGGDGRVVMQPVIAELLIDGEQVEVNGFPDVNSLAGKVSLRTDTKRIQITPATKAEGEPTPKTVQYAYQLDGNRLILTDSRGVSIALERVLTVQDPVGNAQVEVVAAKGIDEAGNLLVTEFTVLRGRRADATYYRPEARVLKTKQSTILLIQEADWKEITIAEARARIREATPVAVIYRDQDQPSLRQTHALWQEAGPPVPDSIAVGRTLSKILRPGTLVFVLSARENAPQP
jgi:hypothetical protein